MLRTGGVIQTDSTEMKEGRSDENKINKTKFYKTQACYSIAGLPWVQFGSRC